MEAFAVVVFEESIGEDEVELIATSWLMDEDKSVYGLAGFKNRWKVTKAIKEMWKPEETWSVYSIRTLAKCRDYSAGRILARKAEHASDIINDGEYGRQRDKACEDTESSDSTSRPNQKSLPEPPEIQFEETNNPGGKEYSNSHNISRLSSSKEIGTPSITDRDEDTLVN
ncbi:hypothetical protein Pmani_029716 [Petrolisthes manimaculis]|uniref:Uncharacterized protein n=1 Tax=Petrolisthes manimaculis TaxID=1843537 RepID=A0AAE1TTK6_9EUCA|nr:hypothetical protein Pmani_029716 [Petrolisthes manimaculis]